MDFLAHTIKIILFEGTGREMYRDFGDWQEYYIAVDGKDFPKMHYSILNFSSEIEHGTIFLSPLRGKCEVAQLETTGFIFGG
jgi:hypothetical protein